MAFFRGAFAAGTCAPCRHAERGPANRCPTAIAHRSTDVIRQRMRRESLSLAAAREQLSQFLDIPMVLRVPSDLHADALQLAERYDLPSVYDAHYVALAQRLGCTLWTFDERLLRSLRGELPLVRSIAEYVSPSDADR